MASIVQAGPDGSYEGSGSPGQVLGSTTTIGHGVLLILTPETADTVNTLTSPIGTFTFIGQSADTYIGYWYCPSATGAGDTVTPTYAGGATWFGLAIEISVPIVSAYVADNENVPSGANVITNTFSPHNIGDFIVSTFNSDNSNLTTPVPSSPWTMYNSTNSGGIWYPLTSASSGTATQFAASTSSQTITWNAQYNGDLDAITVGLVLTAPTTLTKPSGFFMVF